MAANKVVIPTKAEYLSYRGIKALKNTIANIKDSELNTNLTLAGFIITMFEARINDQKDIAELLHKEAEVMGTVKKSADTYRHILDGKPVVISDKNSDVAKSYIKIAKLL